MLTAGETGTAGPKVVRRLEHEKRLVHERESRVSAQRRLRQLRLSSSRKEEEAGLPAAAGILGYPTQY